MKRWWTLTLTLIAPLALAGIGCETMYVASNKGDTAVKAGEADPADFVITGQTTSFFTAFQVDPRSEDSAGPQLVAAADLDGDGLMDLASAWNESQPIQAHLQRRDVSGNIVFETVPIAGTTPI
ncbi:MAG: hypothetical protein ACYSUI_04405, partial [Planctomycetota bacterium]